MAFAAVPEPVPGPGPGDVVGIDRGVAVTPALPGRTAFQAPAPRSAERRQPRLSRARRGSNRRFTLNADVNAARDVPAGHAVTARGGSPPGGPVNR